MKLIKTILIIFNICLFINCSDNNNNQIKDTNNIVWATAKLPELIEVDQEITINGDGFMASDILILKNSESVKTKISDAIFSEKQIKFLLPEDFAGGNYIVILKRGNIESILGVLKVKPKPIIIKGKRITQMSFSDSYDPATWTISYDEQMRINKINIATFQNMDYELTYEDKRIIVSGYENIIYNLDENGRILSTEKDGIINSWTFNEDNYLTEGDKQKYTYTNGNLTTLGFRSLIYDNTTQENIYKKMDLVVWIYWIPMYFNENPSILLPHLLGLCGNVSKYLPTAEEYGNPIEYSFDEENNVTKISFESGELGGSVYAKFTYE